MTTELIGQPDEAVVCIRPANIEITVPAGMRLMQAAQAAGIRWPNVCNGQAQCGICAIEVVDGDLAASEPGIRESQMLDRLTQRPRHGGVMRLACQFVPQGRVVAHKLGVRAAPAAD